MTPLLAFLFASPWLAALTAAGAVAVPVVIHLLNRKRFRVVTWAAMRFLLAAQKQNVRRMKLEQILLLAVRCALLLLLVLAMASVTPWAEAMWYKVFPDSAVLAAAGSQRTHKILVLDGSFSMALKAEDGDCFARAKKRAGHILEHSPGGDGFSVVLMAAPPQRVVPEPSDDPGRVAAEVGKLRLPHGNADLAGTLQAVEDMVRRSPPKYEAREVYFLTDLQRSTWKEQTVAKVAEKVRQLQSEKPVRLIFVDVGRVEDGGDPSRPRDSENLAVTQLTLGAPLAVAGVETPLRATLYNYGREELKKVKVELLVGRARATPQEPPFEMQVVTPPRMEPVSVPAGQAIPVTIPYTFPRPGDYAVQVRVAHDRLEVDDSRALVVTVKETVPVLLVNGKPAAKLYDQATSFLYDALNPYGKEQPPRDAPLRPRVLSESEFGDAHLGELEPYDCVFLCDVPSLRKTEVARLETHLRRGGGIVFCLGPRVDLEAYNRLVYLKGEGLLPGPLVGVEHAPEGGPAWAFDLEGTDLKKPPLEPFLGEAERGSLGRARFREYVLMQLPTQSRARRVLSFVPEPERAGEVSVKEREARAKMRVRDPAVVEWPRYRGRVVVVTSSANMDWTTWPGSPSYLVFMQELVRHAVAGRLHDQAALVGEPLEVLLPAALGGKEVTFKTPDGRKATAAAEARDDAALLRFADTDQSGLYVATVADEPREYLFAVNPPAATEGQQASESNLARVTETELSETYSGWKFQIVTDPAKVVRAPVESVGGDAPPILHGMGSVIARWLLLALFALLLGESLLAWKLGHHTSVPSNEATPSGRLLPVAVGLVAGLAFLALAGVLLHTAWTDDFLGFLPDRLRAWGESFLGVPQLVSGESSHWRLEYKPYLMGGRYEPWLVGVIAAAAIAYVVGVYLAEGRTAGRGYRLLLAGLRALLVLVVLVVLLPQLQLWFERQGWPDVALIIDDSGSMATADQYHDPRVKEAADQLARVADLPRADRLRLAQALLTHPDRDWLKKLVLQRKVKVHVYHCSAGASRLADVTEAGELDAAIKEVKALPPKKGGEDDYGAESHLGTAVRQVLGDFRGSSLSAVIMLTDGVTTAGDDLVQASRHASKAGVPLFFVGMGDAQEARDLILHDLQVEDSVFVGDRLVFEARFTAQGYTNLPPVTVELCEKGSDGKDEPVAPSRPEDPPTRVKVTPDPQGKPVKFRVVYRPATKGEKTYVLRLAKESEPPDEVDKTNNRVERKVKVEEARPSRVLYIEGYPRPEFRALKPMLEREAGDPAKKSIDLKVLLLDAQDDWHLQDKSARPDFPTKEELNQFDLVILGDVDPKHAKLGEKNLKLLVDFVRERGGGLLMIAGKRDNPRSFKDTPLADVMPIRLTGGGAVDDPDAPRREGFRPQLTALGRSHPMFRLRPDEAANTALWEKMPEIFWFADGYALQPAAAVLAVHPKQRAVEPRPGSADERHPLVVQHFVGNGRCLFLGFDETWAWAFRDSVVDYNRFWVQTVHYLARSRLGRIDLRLDRTTPYRRGEPVKVTVRFPDDQQPPKEGTKVQVLVQRRAPDQPAGPVEEKWTLALAKVDGSRGTFEALQTPTPAGHYTFTLALPAEASPPRAECRVLPPPDETARVSMNQADMERAAEETSGKFYTLADADKLLDDLPTGARVTLKTPGPPWLLWNHFLAFALVLGLLGGEWVLRKRKHLL